MASVEIDGPAAFGTVAGRGVEWLDFRVTQACKCIVLASAAADLGMIDYSLWASDRDAEPIGGPFKRQLTRVLEPGTFLIKLENRRPRVAAYRVRVRSAPTS